MGDDVFVVGLLFANTGNGEVTYFILYDDMKEKIDQLTDGCGTGVACGTKRIGNHLARRCSHVPLGPQQRKRNKAQSRSLQICHHGHTIREIFIISTLMLMASWKVSRGWFEI